MTNGTSRTRLQTAAAVVFYVDAGMWLVGTVPTMGYAFVRRALPRFWDITLCGGPFESLGIDGVMIAGMLYIFVNAFKILAADWLRQKRRDGGVLGLLLVGLSTFFWYGFQLPLGPLMGLAEVVLLIVVWKKLT
jgi:hypothetical protein